MKIINMIDMNEKEKANIKNEIQNECDVMSKLSHPYIIKIREHFPLSNDQYAIIMNLAKGSIVI